MLVHVAYLVGYSLYYVCHRLVSKHTSCYVNHDTAYNVRDGFVSFLVAKRQAVVDPDWCLITGRLPADWSVGGDRPHG